MRQWKNSASNEYVIEKRNREDILKQIRQLAASYTPEWQFDQDNPDIGSVIALLFADGMEENLRRYNTLLERDYVELMNMLGISLRPAFPSHSVVLMELARNTIPGLKLRKGIKLIGGAEEQESLVFETAHSVYVTESRLQKAFMASGRNGKVIPLLGSFPPVEYVDGTTQNTALEDVAEEVETGEDFSLSEEVSQPKTYPFRLFDFQKEGYGKYGLLFYHPYLFDVQDNEIIMKISGAPELVRDIALGKYTLSYYGDSGFEPVQDIHVQQEEYVSFHKQGECRKITENGEDYSVLLLEPVKIPEKSVMVSSIGFSSQGEGREPELIWNGTSEMETGQFLPFGERLGLYAELYIGQNEYFSKQGSKITVEFDLDFETYLASIPRQQEEAELKIIKKKPKKDIMGAPAEVYADEVSLEYYNGIGWRKLVTDAPIKQLFGNDKSRHCRISFLCPEDMKVLETGGYQGRCIRIQITRCDNCYYQPALHHYPVISNMRISYSYEEQFEKPGKIYSYQGSRKRELSVAMEENPMVTVFSNSRYQDTALYLGFDKKMEDGPVSLFIQTGDMEHVQQGRLTFSYSTRDGFSRLKLTDHTEGFSHSGTLMFMPPTDMAKRTLEGQEAYWIKITDEKDHLEKYPLQRPTICNIQINAVEVDNIDTMTEDAYYIDTFGPNMEFALNAENILSLDLWVNETGLFSETEMRRMLAEDPEHTKAEYSFLGEIEEFYVKWKEVDNFDRSTAGDRHYMVDRMNSRLHFGDGVHVQVPRNTKGTAFKVIIRRCDGELANVDAGMIGDSLGGMMFVDRIYNPIQAYGGTKMETVEEALRRGTSLLSTRNRLISALDYERETLGFSRQIAQAKVITNQKKDGSFSPGAVSIVVLMEDYQEGEHSFLHMKQRLRRHLLNQCELSVVESELEIVEPIFAEISVEAWVSVLQGEDTFEVQQNLHHVLEEYLDPVKNSGWEIGRMVKKAQIELRLNMEKGKVLLRRLMVTATYQDETGRHEVDLEKISANPYILVTSGNHKIHFE
ncbi:MAG: hypothetical protein ACI4FV_10230 [Lachnospiraceae bacterium]